jgi:hypothetical protein
MKQTVATVAGVLVLVLLLTMTIVGEVGAQTITKEQTERCKIFSEVAGNMMVVRQSGGTLVYLLGVIDEQKGANEEVVVLLKGMAIEAYNETRFMSEEFQKRAISDFSSYYEVECINQYWSGK